MYHVSSNPKIKTLHTQRPCKYFIYDTTKGIHIEEEHKTERVSFSNTVQNCLDAIGIFGLSHRMYVYKNIDDVKTKIPSIEEVPDCFLSHEIWCLESCRVKRIGVIEIINKKEVMKNTNRGFRIPYCKCNWKWLSKSK